MTMPIDPLPPPRRPRGLQWFVSAAVAAGLLALGLSVKNAMDLDKQADAREAAAAAADLKVCQQTNELRESVKEVGLATEALVDGILDVSFAARADDPRVAAFLTQLEPLFEAHREVLAAIELIDCRAVVKGA